MENIVEIGGKKYKAGPWQIWNGGENPVPFKSVQVQYDAQTRLDAEKSSVTFSQFVPWLHYSDHDWENLICYRVMEEIKPEVKQVTRWIELSTLAIQGVFTTASKTVDSVAKITFNLVDGKPDPESIKMELI